MEDLLLKVKDHFTNEKVIDVSNYFLIEFYRLLNLCVLEGFVSMEKKEIGRELSTLEFSRIEAKLRKEISKIDFIQSSPPEIKFYWTPKEIETITYWGSREVSKAESVLRMEYRFINYLKPRYKSILLKDKILKNVNNTIEKILKYRETVFEFMKDVLEDRNKSDFLDFKEKDFKEFDWYSIQAFTKHLEKEMDNWVFPRKVRQHLIYYPDEDSQDNLQEVDEFRHEYSKEYYYNCFEYSVQVILEVQDFEK